MKTYKSIPVRGPDYGRETLVPGDYYLVRTRHLTRGWERYDLRREPGCTNLSCEPRVTGWLGTTNDLARHAEGCVRVYRDRAGRTRIRPLDASVLVRAAETAERSGGGDRHG